MKTITSKDKPFEAKLSGIVSYPISSEPITVPDSDALVIQERWGALVLIEDASLTDTITAIQTDTVQPTVPVAPQADILPVSPETPADITPSTEPTVPVAPTE